jgi:hypothetical protein
MTRIKDRFHYTDEKDMETTPEKATRITLLSYDQNEKICSRIDWVRDESNICKNCDTEQDTEITFNRTDGIIDFKNKSSEYHDRRDLSQTLLNAIKLLDDSLARLYGEECGCEMCRMGTDNDKR